MMISPEGYYEEYLNGKTAEQIMTAIRGLKNEIGRMKNIMEHPDYGSKIFTHPSESTRLKCTRMYLERAKHALIEVGGTYNLSKADLRAVDFEENIPFINKVIFCIGGYFSGYETRTFMLNEDHVYMDAQHTLIPNTSNLKIKLDFSVSKGVFLEGIRKLHIGEWRTNYNLHRFGDTVLDGTQWDLEIQFSNGHKLLKIYGDNAYPYNFDELKELLSIVNDY